MRLNLNLSPSTAAAQRWAASGSVKFPVAPSAPAPICPTRKRSPFNFLMTRNRKPVRIVPPIVTPRPMLRGNKSYLRALRAAEMVLWNANPKFPTVVVLLLALLTFVATPVLATLPQPPELAVPVFQSGGLPVIRLNGSADSNYVIEASADLKSWEKVHAGTAIGGLLQFTHTNFGNAPRMFYRGRVALPGEVANPFSVIPQLDTNQTVSALITPDGGMLSLTNLAGVVFELNIAPRALLTEEIITLTAITNLGGLPFAATAAGAVLIQPDGLLLLQPTTLTVRGASVASNSVASFTFGEDGGEFHLLPDAPTNSTVTTWLKRLGGAGVVNGTRTEIKAQLGRLPSSPAAQLQQTLAGAGLQRRMSGVTPVLVTHPEADQALAEFYTNHIAAVFVAENNSDFTPMNIAAAPEPEIVLESITIFRDGVAVHHERFPQPQSGDDFEQWLANQPTTVYLDSCGWAKSRLTKLAAKCGLHNPKDLATMLVLADWVDFQCPDDSAEVRAMLSDCLRFQLNFDSHIITVAGPVVMDSKVHVKNLPLKWQGGKTFSGVGTVSYDSFSITPPPAPCWRDGIEYHGGPFQIQSLEFDLNFKKKKTPRLLMKYIAPAATENWVVHCPGPGGVVDIPTSNAVMWLGAYIIGHQPDFTVRGWSFPGGSKFATREYLQATVHEDALITEASKFELIHAPQ